MSTTNEIEILLKKAVTLLHSSHANSATELRLLLDEEIKKRYGTEKTITNSLSKKQMEDEVNFPGRAATPPPQPVESEEVINLIHSPAKTISDSPDTIADSDDGISGAGGLLSTTAEEETNLKEFGDLNCCVCGEIRFTATNRLIECSKCGALYHQECHKPPITDDEASEEQGHTWQCDNCIGKPITTTTKLSGSCASGLVVIPDEPMPLITTSSVASIKSKSSATSSRSSSSSNSSSPYHKMEQVQLVNSVVAGKASSKTHREERSSSGSSKVTSINSSITSAKKHSSSSTSGKSKSSSKHHDSKRKSNK
ncbi:integrator complex subunit 12 [Calliphora vicina]|uniref:integrator complex subunit 12 n=1 Tax=Calliphora vicina TaxID=7373 RepID=UPI00325A44D5